MPFFSTESAFAYIDKSITKSNSSCFFIIICFKLILFDYTQNENVDNLLRLRLLRYRQTPNVLKRINAHAERRERSTSVLVHLPRKFCRFSEDKNLKVDVHPICPFLLLSQPIGSYGFIGLILCFYLSISLTYSCIVTSWSLGQSISFRARKCESLETMYSAFPQTAQSINLLSSGSA